ncbi:MAG: aminotransferase class IV [Candidatus Komeilibacteria bacterium]|nr:aminotransferase class IV [Candidatus Komeilibacteria bacterium]
MQPSLNPFELDWLVFGFDFNHADGYANAEWSSQNNFWTTPAWVDGSYFKTHVASPSLDYGFGVIEGFQVFRRQNGSIWAFRPFDHWQRLNDGATSENLGLQAVPKEVFLDCLQKTVQGNSRCVPTYEACLQGASFYIRPKLLGADGQFRVRFPSACILTICGSPVGPYWKTGFKPNKLLWIDGDPRSMPSVKWPGNYTPTGIARKTAEAVGCVAPLFSIKHKATETHAAGFGAIIDGVYVCRGDYRVLASITQRSLLHLCQDEGIQVQRTELRQQDLTTASEMMAVGTAAGIQPIDTIRTRVFRRDNEYHVGDLHTPWVTKGLAGPFATKMSQRLWQIKTGQMSDPYGWMVQVG